MSRTEAQQRLYQRLTRVGGPPAGVDFDAPLNAAGLQPLGGEADPTASATDLAPLEPEEIDALLHLLRSEPESVLARAKVALDSSITLEALEARLLEVQAAMRAPDAALDMLDARSRLLQAAELLPPELEFEGMDLAGIPIDPGDTKFETTGDLWGWTVNSGRYLFGAPTGLPGAFRWHDAAGLSEKGFVYPLRWPDSSEPLSVALFADFGTGRYHSRYIAKQLARRAPAYAVHLGDVYYSGRSAEFRENFERPLAPLLDRTRLFTLNSNHEMFSLGVPYFDYMQRRRQHPIQEQQGSYFCLRGQKVQFIAIDTDYFGQFRYRDPKLLLWLERQLEHGRAHGLTNILLSPDEPYAYGSTSTTSLLEDLEPLVVQRSLVDLWFWGNTHYCALFDRAPSLPFIGSCIGHGGYPYDRMKPGRSTPAPLRFLETAARFPEWTRVRQDRGNNGYCMLHLQPSGDLKLQYIDWMAHDRALVDIARREDGRLSFGRVQVF